MNDTQTWLDQLLRAVNEHDLEALTACFAADYVNLTPAHPARAFAGRDQVRRNWEQIFTYVPDLRAEVLAAASDGPIVWTEWDMRGTRRDGSAHHLTGVVIFDLDGGTARRATFYLEPVDDGSGSVDQAVREQVVR